MTLGHNVRVTDKEIIVENTNFDRYLLPEFYDCYNVDEIPDHILNHASQEVTNIYSAQSEEINNSEKSIQPLDGPMDSPWPMYCHDVRHTGRSPYSTVDTWDEIWRFKQHMNDFVRGSPAIGDDGTIYFGGADFYALYPNGTLKWKYDDLDFYVWSAPAIDENGVLYVGDLHGYFYAINADGSLKWRCLTGDDILSSPAIGDDGTIFVGDGGNWHIKAFNPNGTLKWAYKTGHVVYSSPAIGNDGTVYCGSHDTYLYALYPNNGTLKWKYGTGHWIRTSPCIADDGTIYVVSLDSHLHAVNPDGTKKWSTDVGAGTSPTIGQDETIYAGYGTLHAIYPTNGSVKWTFGVSGNIKGSTPCHSLEDTIYFGTDSGWLYAVNSDGTLKWRENIANAYVDSAPAIAEDGTLYVGSAWEVGGYSKGYLHAFGIGNLTANADGPYYGLINRPVQFKGSASGGYSPYVSWHWDFGDGGTSDEQNPTYTYTDAWNYTVTLTVTDNTGNTSSDTSWARVQETNDPPVKPIIDGREKGDPHQHYDYTFVSSDPEENPVWYYVDWDDDINTGWIGPYSSSQTVKLTHTWHEEKIFIIKAKAKDIFDAESDWATFEVNLPRSKIATRILFFQFLERFPLLERLLNLL